MPKGSVSVKSKWCKGCGICLSFCPQKVFSLDEKGKARVNRPEKCRGCAICENLCPDFAITVVKLTEGGEGVTPGAPAV